MFMMLPRAIKRAVFQATAGALYHSGLYRLANKAANRTRIGGRAGETEVFPFVRTRRRRSVQILIYHRVNDEGDPFFTGLPVGLFRQQMQYLRENCHVLPLGEAVDRMTRNDVPENAVVITLDDGYHDNFDQAFPVFRELDLPATIFLATDAVGTDRPIWHDVVFSAFRETRVPSLSGLPRPADSFRLDTLEAKLHAQTQVVRFLWTLNPIGREQCIGRLADQLEVERMQRGSKLMLDWDEVRLMQEHRITFGAHTATHPILSRLQAGEVKAEVLESKRVIEQQLGVPVTAFAYPVGRRQDFTEETKDIVRDAGFSCAVSTIAGSNEAGNNNIFELRRATPWDQDLASFALRLAIMKWAS